MDKKTILPVCRYCRRVCDERNYWLRVPGNLYDRANVQCQPTICPLCQRRRAPVYIEELQSK